MQSLFLLSFLSAALTGPNEPPTTAETIQRRAVDERLKIHRGEYHVRFEVVGSDAEGVDVQVFFDFEGKRFLRM